MKKKPQSFSLIRWLILKEKIQSNLFKLYLLLMVRNACFKSCQKSSQQLGRAKPRLLLKALYKTTEVSAPVARKQPQGKQKAYVYRTGDSSTPSTWSRKALTGVTLQSTPARSKATPTTASGKWCSFSQETTTR